MTTFITINKHAIARNVRAETPEPPIRVAGSKYGKPEYCSNLSIVDATGNTVAELVYSPHEPLMGCGARLVLKTDLDVRLGG